MALSKKDFKVLDALDSEPITTQRQLSEHTGISLGQITMFCGVCLKKVWSRSTISVKIPIN